MDSMYSQFVAADSSQVLRDAGRVRDGRGASFRIRTDQPRHQRPRADVIADVPNQRTSCRTRPGRQDVHLETVAVDQVRCEAGSRAAQSTQIGDAGNAGAPYSTDQPQPIYLPSGGSARAGVAQARERTRELHRARIDAYFRRTLN